MGKELRVSLTLSGGASLGAFQAGAAAALSVAVRHLAEREGVDARVDAVGGASAGSIVAVATAHALLDGIDPVDLLGDLWVNGVTLRLLRSRGLDAPLTLDRVRERAPEFLDPRGARRTGRQEHPVGLHVALTGLQGLVYRIGGEREDRADHAMTYVDWMQFELLPGRGLQQLLEPEGRAPLDAVLASAAHPGAFAPRILDRREDEAAYRRQGITNFPKSGHLWYTDGGLLQTEPLGRVLDAARRLDASGGGAERINLVIDPRSEAPLSSERWSDRDHAATWLSGLSRALAILPAQAIYNDVRSLETDNRRLRRCADLADRLAPHLDQGASDALAEFLGEAGDGDVRAALRAAFERIAGVDGKHPVTVDVISPLLLAQRGEDDVTELLAGEMLGDFGGFLSARLRASDFALGYESALVWLDESLGDRLGQEDAARRATDAVRERRPRDWEAAARGRSRLGDLSRRGRARLASLGTRYLLALANEVRARR